MMVRKLVHDPSAQGLAYNPAQTKIPVNTPFCEAVVRSRQSRGIGYIAVSDTPMHT